MTQFPSLPFGSLLGVWAHPDDECYLSAGLMRKTAVRNQRVVCVTATHGEGGVQDERRWPAAELAAIRDEELAESLAILGVEEHHYLDVADGACADIDATPFVARLTDLIAEMRPAVVVTFGPDGITDHPDHKAVGAWTTEAFTRAAVPGAELWYPVYPADWEPVWGHELRALGAYPPGFPPLADRRDLVASLALDGDDLDRKVAALCAQRSQVGPIVEALTLPRYRAFLAEECFRLGARQPPRPARRPTKADVHLARAPRRPRVAR